MLFSERVSLARQYGEWLYENPEERDCPLTFLAFLDRKGILKDEIEEDDEKEEE